MYYFTYPFKKMYISQNYNQGNHKPHWYGSKNYKDYPIDEFCGDKKKDPVYAPVDMKVLKIYGLHTTKTTNAIVLQTTEKVRTPIGDKVVIMTLTHSEDCDIEKLKVGQIIKKGKIICYEGNDGQSTGNHIHLTVGTGSYKGLLKNSNGKWCFVETTTNKPEELIYVNTKFTKILNSDGIKFKTVTTDVVPSTGFFPPKGYWEEGDTSKNIGKVCKFYADKFYGYFCKTSKEAHKLLDGNYFGKNCLKWTKEFQKRCKADGLYKDKIDGKINSQTLKCLEHFGFKY